MNHVLDDIARGSVKAANLPSWMLSHGIVAVTTEEAAHLIGVPSSSVRQNMATQRRRGAIISPSRGLWVAVPDEFRGRGAPDPIFYLDSLMRHLDVSYCIGWLSAAACYGASHQATQVFQVAVSSYVGNRTVGAAYIEFSSRSYLESILTHTVRTSQGHASAASVGTTMLMLASDVELASGIHNAATSIIELAEENDGWLAEVEHDMELFPVSATRRIGWILERFVDVGDLDALARSSRSRSSSISVVSPQSRRGGYVNQRWNLEINKEVDPDL